MKRRIGKAIAKKGHAMLGLGGAVIAAIPAAIAALVALSLPSLA